MIFSFFIKKKQSKTKLFYLLGGSGGRDGAGARHSCKTASLSDQCSPQRRRCPTIYQWRVSVGNAQLKKAQVEVPVESVQESNVANFVLSEFGLREKKKKNVIVFGVPESKSSK